MKHFLFSERKGSHIGSTLKTAWVEGLSLSTEHRPMQLFIYNAHSLESSSVIVSRFRTCSGNVRPNKLM